MGKDSGDVGQVARAAIVVKDAARGSYVVRLLPNDDHALLSGTNGRHFREGERVDVYIKSVRWGKITAKLAPSDNGKQYHPKSPKKD